MELPALPRILAVMSASTHAHRPQLHVGIAERWKKSKAKPRSLRQHDILLGSLDGVLSDPRYASHEPKQVLSQ